MKMIEEIVDSIKKQYQVEEIAVLCGVRSETVRRWIKHTSKPQSSQEAILRDFYMKNAISISQDGAANQYIDQCLANLREIFHKSSRLSTRNEAVEEISKLFFAHIVSFENGGGLCYETVSKYDKTNIANALNRFVIDMFRKNICSNDTIDFDYQLRIKETEEKLASEIINAFQTCLMDNRFMINIKRSDVLNEIFGKFLADSFIDEKQLGQYLTPQEVVKFAVDLLFVDIDNAGDPC